MNDPSDAEARLEVACTKVIHLSPICALRTRMVLAPVLRETSEGNVRESRRQQHVKNQNEHGVKLGDLMATHRRTSRMGNAMAWGHCRPLTSASLHVSLNESLERNS